MKVDLKTAAFLSSMFFASHLNATEAQVLDEVASQLPATKTIQDKELLESFLIENASSLSAETINGIAGLMTQSKKERLEILKNLGAITGDIRFMGNQPECTDVRGLSTNR